MADQRQRQPVKIVDPTTDANEAGVSAAGDLQVEVAVALPAGTNNIGDVDVLSLPALPAGSNNIGDVDVLTTPADATDGSAHGASQQGFRAMGSDGTNDQQIAVDASGNVQVDIVTGGGGPEDTDDDVVAGGQSAVLGIGLNYGWDGTQWERIHSDASGALDVNVTTALPAGANNIGDVDIASAPTGASAIEIQGTAADGAAAVGDPVQIGGVDGSANVQRILTDTDGHLQVDVLSGAGASTPTNPTIDTANSTNTAAGASSDLDSAEITEAEKLYQVQVSASVPFKFQVKIVENSVPRNISAFVFGRANEVVMWTPPHIDFAAHAGASGGTDVFRVTCFNQDNNTAADLHAGFFYAT